MDELNTFGDYSPAMMWDMQKETRDQLNEHCRTHKIDIDKIHEDTTEIKQSIAELTQTVSLLAQKIESMPPQIPPRQGFLSSCKAAALAAVVIFAGIAEGLQYVKKI